MHKNNTMKDEKYYFIVYKMEVSKTSTTQNNCVSDKHPFEWLEFVSKLSSIERTLVDWKEITKGEYEMGKRVIGIG